MNFRLNFNSITTRLILLGVTIVIVGAFARTIVLTEYLRNDLGRQTADHLLALSSYVAKDIDNNVVSRRDLLKRVALKLPLSLLKDPLRLQAWLAENHYANPLFNSGFFVLDTSGTALVYRPALTDQIKTSFSDRDYFKQAVKGEFAIGRPSREGASNVTELPMAMPLRDSAGKVQGVLVGITALDSSSFLDSLNRTKIGATGGLLLISPRDQLFIGASNASLALKPTPKEGTNELHDRAMHGYRGDGITVNAFGVEELVGIASVPSSSWFVVARLPTSEAFSSIVNLQHFVLEKTLIIVPALILVLVFLLRYLLRPLMNSARLADRMTLGEIALEPLPVVRDDEVGHLTVAFNRLLSRLLKNGAELELNQRELQATLESVKNSEALLRESQLIAGLGSYLLDISTSRWKSSDVLNRLFGIDEAYEFTIEGWADLIHPDDRAMMIDYLTNDILGKGQLFDKEYRIICQDDKTIRWVHELGKLEFDEHGHPTSLRGTIQDITVRKNFEENLLVTASVFGSSQEGIMITDTDNNIIDVNAAFSRITGYSKDEVIGKNPGLLSSGRQDKTVYADMWKSLKRDKGWRGEIWNRRKSGEVYAEQLSITAICDDNGKVIRHVAVFSDISHIKAHVAELSKAAHFDGLTGIPNRILLADRMKQAIAQTSREQSRMATCYLDLDGFKAINDTMGHEAGDYVLIEIARRIENTIRGGDTVARLGGDEFAVLLLGLEKNEECMATLERLLAVIAQPIIVKGKPATVSASIGVSIYPIDNEDPETLLRHADQAMYIAKQSGKNRFHIYNSDLDLGVYDQNQPS